MSRNPLKPEFEKDDGFVVLGRKRVGKSYLARKILARYPRVVIFDPVAEYDELEATRSTTWGTFENALVDLHGKPQFTLVHDFNEDLEGEDLERELNAMLRALFKRGRQFATSTLIVIEEVQNFCSPHRLPNWLKKCVLEGGHAELAVVCTTQRPGECHKTIISQASHVFCGSLHDRGDLEYARSVLGESSEKLRMFPKREFLYFRPGLGTLHIDNDFHELGKISTD